MSRLAISLFLFFFCGCSGGMSSEVRQEAYPLESFSQLRQNTGEYVGETVILGGEIIETRNEPDHTTLLILERPLGYDRRPKAGAKSAGRLRVRFDDYLDPAIYKPGRRVTVAGRVTGTETEPVGSAPYVYVVLEGREIRVWQEYDPYYSRDPYYYYPLFHYPFRRHRPTYR